MNANKLTEVMEVDYRTVRHHLDLLEKNGLITSMGPRYGRMYFISDILEQSYSDFEEIWKESGKRDNNNSGG
jgi:DNA-binding transcriptional ArsR family regulator